MTRILLVFPLMSQKECPACRVGQDGEPEPKWEYAPITLATLAAITPADYQVDLWDELVKGYVPSTVIRGYDLIGVSGYALHKPRALELAAIARGLGLRTAVGGPGVSTEPEAYRGHFDYLFVGEAEETWPEFLKDFETGRPKEEYRQIAPPDISLSPSPAWDRYGAELRRDYGKGCIQTTRGCPFDCEFCDVIYLFGRRSRHREVKLLLHETKRLHELGMRQIFFTDDEFVGDKKWTKEFLRQLIPLNNSFDEPCAFGTQCTLTLAKDDELLRLAADANFYEAFMGLESANADALRSINKKQNIRPDMAADIKKVLAHGVGIRGSFIFGLDPDTASVFETTFDFVNDCGIPNLFQTILRATIGTRTWARLLEEERVVDLDYLQKECFTSVRAIMNLVPKNMSRVECMEGYLWYTHETCRWENFGLRARRWVSLIERQPDVREPSVDIADFRRLVAKRNLEGAAQKVLDDVYEYTREHQPWMLPRMLHYATLHSCHIIIYVDNVCRELRKQADLEKEGKVRLVLERRELRVPPLFSASFEELFEPVHARVYVNLQEPALAAEALTEVFVDFLLRWGHSFAGVEPHHHQFLKELADRTCAVFNGVEPSQFLGISPEESGAVVPNPKKTRIAGAVLKAVGDELIRRTRLMQSGAARPPETAVQVPAAVEGRKQLPVLVEGR